jgi:adenosylhomocysteine nucleosidase
MQVDMDARALGFELGQTPFDEVPVLMEVAPIFSHLPSATCSSADRFDDGSSAGHPREVVDMEAYALSKVCHLEALPFASAKYISDGADHNAANDWQASLPIAARCFRDLYARLLDQG